MSTIHSIHLASRAGEPMASVTDAQLDAGRGIVGDRYHAGIGEFSKKLERGGKGDWQLTLIEIEEINRFVEGQGLSLGPGEFRRNIVTSGVRLNSLVGKVFFLDGIRLEGVRLCEPCAYLAGLVTETVLPGMVGRCGLRARVLDGGKIQVGGKVDPSAD